MILKIKNRKLFSGAISLLFLFVLLMPVLTHAALVNCSISNTTGIIGDNKVGGGCDFTDFIQLINDIINWIIGIAGVIFTLMAVYGGFLYMTSGDNPGNKGKAKSILWNTLLGFVIILTAWLIVYTLLNFLVDPSQKGSVFKFIGNGN